MSSFIINIKTEINSRKLRYYVSRFLNNPNSSFFKSRYIQVELYLYNENSNSIQIGNTYYLDTKNSIELKTFHFIIQQNYFSSNIEDKINKIEFKYTELKKVEYLSIKNKK